MTLAEPLEVTAEARKYNAWLFDRTRPYLGQRVLDAGAGIGTFTEMLADGGHEVVALEPDSHFAKRLRDRFARSTNVTVIEGTAEILDTQFDAILCLNVLEHIDDDASAISTFHDRLVVGGRLLLIVPAHPSLFGRTDRVLGHYRRYTRERLRALLSQAGYEVETLRHVNPIGALGWLLWFRFRTPRGRWPAWPYRAYDRLVPLLRPLDALRLPVGLSLWSVARRPLSRCSE